MEKKFPKTETFPSRRCYPCYSMDFYAKALTLPLLAFGIATAPAKILTGKQAQDAAARVDSLIAADLKAANLRPNGRIDDGTFLRRAYLGIIGRIPTVKESRAFLDNPSAKKRESLVDVLVASPGFDSHLFNWTADLLRIQTSQEQFGLGWHVWLRKSLSENKPWDTIVLEMLASTGHTAKNPAVGYYLRDRNMQLDNFSNTMQVFLGRQIGCAQCHDHPFDDWSQYEYYQMAAFGGGFDYRSTDAQATMRKAATELHPTTKEKAADLPKDKRAGKIALRDQQLRKSQDFKKISKLLQPVFKDFNKNALFDNPENSLRLPEDYQYSDAAPNTAVAAETLFGEKITAVPPEQRREVFAKWVASRDNPFFTKVIANRLWARTFSHGLLDPVDDWSEDSVPAHPEVLAFLETSMKAVDYDLRQFCRILFLTDLFQRECDPTEPEPGVPHPVKGPALQRMTAEQLYDSMLVLTLGEVEDSPLAANANRWENYTAGIEKILTAESSDLLVLGEATSQADAAFREAQSELREVRSLISKAKPGPERSKLYARLVEIQGKHDEYRRQRNPLSMMDTDMSMEMQDAGRRKNKGGLRSSARASELPAPFNPGTLVREFGGSDRTTPSSGDTIPTVPQALALLNDRDTDIIGGKRNTLNSRISSLKTPEERLDLIFLLLYSRPPSAEEKQHYAPLAKDDTTLRDLTRAMLTSNRFIFIQ
jgi:hypothetical protein